MTIPPDILEQIEKETDRKYGDIESAVSFGQKTGFKAGAQFGYSLRQKQTPPPTYTKEYKLFGDPIKVFDCTRGQWVHILGVMDGGKIHVREITPRDQKIAQAVEGLELTLRKILLNIDRNMEATEGESMTMEMVFYKSILEEALSKWEAANEP